MMQDNLPPDSDVPLQVKLLLPVILAILAATARFLMTPKGRSALGYLRGLVAAVLVAYTVNSAAAGYGLNEDYRIACVAIGAFMADDILTGVIVIGEKMRKDPLGFIRSWFKGGSK